MTPLKHIVVRPAQERLVGHGEYLGVRIDLVLDPSPSRGDENIAEAPLDLLAIDEGNAATAHDAEGGVGIGSPAARL